MQSKHNKKMIAPIIITVLFLAYLAGCGYMMIEVTEFDSAAIILAIPLLALGLGMIYTLYTRIKEIRSGEEDDLSNY